MDRKSFPAAVLPMSSSTKSKPASASSPATGGETKAEKTDAEKGSAKTSKGDKPESKGSGKSTKNDSSSGRRDIVEVELEHSRQREIAWTIFGTIGGVLLILKLGTVGVWGGYALIA